MLKRSWLPIALMIPMSLAACGGDSSTAFERLFDLQREAIEWSCECAVAAGQVASVDACLALIDIGFTPSEEECLGKELSKVSGADAAIECAIDATETYVSCLQSGGCPDYSGTFMCEDGSEIPQSFVCDGEADCTGGEDEQNCDGAAASCEANYSTALEACPQVSDAATDAAYMACGIESDPEYTCADGETIPEDWVCDGFDDCAGGEDEANCG